MKPNYGIDAPGLVKAFFAIGAVALVLFAVALAASTPPGWAWLVAKIFVVVVGLYAVGMGCFMLYYSLKVKVIDRERLLDLLDFQKAKRILDVGCGRGLMMIGAAKRTPEVRAVGIDLWLEKDQANNRPEAVLENASLEGVSSQVEVQTADMRKLPFANESFDAVVSHWALHNVERAADRTVACQEIHRVLRSGGALVLADIANHAEYEKLLRQTGFKGVRIVGSNWKTTLCAAVSFGSFKPMSVYGEKA
jgi:ubiquinone/menaquinone biosynthesis C-methylase UbiE